MLTLLSLVCVSFKILLKSRYYFWIFHANDFNSHYKTISRTWDLLCLKLSIICRDGRKKENLKCVRYDVNGECRVLLVACRDICSGERLYYDYNGHEQEYPTHNFV